MEALHQLLIYLPQLPITYCPKNQKPETQSVYLQMEAYLEVSKYDHIINDWTKLSAYAHELEKLAKESNDIDYLGEAKYVRAHFNPGAGVFQMDSAGLGANIGLKEAIYTSDSAPIVAASIARKYKSASGTAAQKRAAAWSDWAACSLDVRLSLTQQVLKAM